MKKLHFIWLYTIFIVLNAQNTVSQQKFSLPELPYAYEALEPSIDKETMMIHHSKHHQAYINNLNTALAGTQGANLTLEELMKNVSKYSGIVRNNGGGHYNHSLFWTILSPNKTTKPSKRLEEAINKQFGSMDSLKIQLNNAALKQFGSGWAWLSVDKNNKLFISSTANQDNPIMDVVEKQGTPILGIDVWEHAYYLKFQNKRGDYLLSIWNVLNWEEISRRYESIVPKGKFDDWQAIKDFHKVMSQTFHPSEKGDLIPIKSRSAEMVTLAEQLSKSKLPTEFDNKQVRSAILELVKDSKKLHKLVQSKKSSDAAITESLNNLHDVFHKIVGLCVHDEAH
jgi:superoxide dismutase